MFSRELSAAHSIAFKSCVIAWAISYIGRACESLAWGFRYHWTFWYRVPQDLLITTGIILIAWKYFRSYKNVQIENVWNGIWIDIAKRIPFLSFGKNISVFLNGWILCTFMLFYAWCSWGDLGKILAVVADRLGAYELAEVIYKTDRSLETKQSFASWQTAFRKEASSVREARNAAVARVYGTNSPQMAQRYFFVGLNYEMDRMRLDPYNDETAAWFEKSLLISRSCGASEQSIDALAHLALIRYEQKRQSEVGTLLKEARVLLPHCMQSHEYGSLGTMSYLASKIGDEKMATNFISAEKQEDRLKQQDDVYWIAWLATHALLPISFCIGTGLFNVLFGNAFIYNYYERVAKNAKCPKDSFEALNKLITFDLYKGNINLASKHSIALLSLMGMHSDSYVNEICEGPKSNRLTLSPILCEQLRAGLLVLMIIRFW